VWPIRTYREKQKDGNEITIYFAENCEPTSKSLIFETIEKMVDFSNIMYNVVENIKGELALKKFGHVNDNENTV
jgi:hypothetical protein